MLGVWLSHPALGPPLRASRWVHIDHPIALLGLWGKVRISQGTGDGKVSVKPLSHRLGDRATSWLQGKSLTMFIDCITMNNN